MATQSESLALPSFDEPPRVLIVVAPYYAGISDSQVARARAVLDRAGAEVEVVEVPGALEIPAAIGIAHRQADFDAYVALGCVIRGETSHYDIVIGESARGITNLGLVGACVGNGILTVESMAQAEARLTDAHDTAGGAAAAALHLAALQKRMTRGPKGIGFRS